MSNYTDSDMFTLAEILVGQVCRCSPKRHPSDRSGAIACASARSAARAVLDCGYRKGDAIATLTEFLGELPASSHERAGVIRAIEVLRHDH